MKGFLFVVSILGIFVYRIEAIVFFQEKIGVSILSREEAASPRLFSEMIQEFSEGCGIQQEILRNAANSLSCGEESFLGQKRDCGAERSRLEKMEADADTKIWGAVSKRKKLAGSIKPSFLKASFLGIAYATHGSWRCIEASVDYGHQVTIEFTPTW